MKVLSGGIPSGEWTVALGAMSRLLTSINIDHETIESIVEGSQTSMTTSAGIAQGAAMGHLAGGTKGLLIGGYLGGLPQASVFLTIKLRDGRSFLAVATHAEHHKLIKGSSKNLGTTPAWINKATPPKKKAKNGEQIQLEFISQMGLSKKPLKIRVLLTCIEWDKEISISGKRKPQRVIEQLPFDKVFSVSTAPDIAGKNSLVIETSDGEVIALKAPATEAFQAIALFPSSKRLS